MSLTIEAGGSSFAFILQVVTPSETLAGLLIFFNERKILLEAVYMQVYQARTARLVIHCRLEKDRIRRTIHLMEVMKGILELEWMESRGSISIF